MECGIKRIDSIRDFVGKYGYAVLQNAPLSEYTTFKVGGPADVLIKLDERHLPELLSMCKANALSTLFLGNGSNLLAGDSGFRGVVIKLLAGEPEFDKNIARCSAGVPLAKLCSLARDRGLSGLEFAYGIPGTVGGALYMNAGAYGGEMSHVVTEATYADENGTHSMQVDQMELGYRRSWFMQHPDAMIMSVILRLAPGDKAAIGARMAELMDARRGKQPLEYPSAGSYFKRPEGFFTGKLITDCGLRGYKIGGAQVSEKHAGFIINKGGATCRDVLDLIAHVQRTVKDNSGVDLECEIKAI